MAFEFLQVPVRRVVELLVSKRYDALVQLTGGKRLDQDMIETAIRSYGRDLVSPPASAYEALDVIEIQNAERPEWSIGCELWTRQEGRSDLSLEMTVIETGNGYEIELDDIHVR